ncbi:MAG: class II aldolase/adducin family protein [Candidatus Omnitrophica bacterium]|nr:class II aldolase/adducin family protein [Candidatus Omnitrophota bacterium]
MSDVKKELAKYGKLLHDKDMVIGSGGNISVKSGKSVTIKKRSVDMSSGGVSGYISFLPKDLRKHEAVLSTETPFHIACYAARPDVKAIVHVHSPAIIAAGEKTRMLYKVSYEFEYVINSRVPVIPYIQPGSTALARVLAKEIKSGANAVIMKKHGAISVGKTLEEAYLRMLALERGAEVFLWSAL